MNWKAKHDSAVTSGIQRADYLQARVTVVRGQRDAALERVAELEAKFNELAIADIVFQDWHNSLEKPARSKLSLRDMKRLVDMLVRYESPQYEEGVAVQMRFLSRIRPGLSAPRCGAEFTGLHASLTHFDTQTGKWKPCEPMAWISDESKEGGANG